MAALIKKPYESNWLFIGDTGTAKTSVAFVVAKAIGATIHHMQSRQCNLESVSDLERHFRCGLLFDDWQAVIVDECDQMSMAAQNAFLSLLDGTATPKKVIFFFTSNNINTAEGKAKLEKRFVGRCRQIPFNGRKEIDEGIEYLEGIWQKETRRKLPDIRELLLENDGNIRASLHAMEVELMASGSSIDAVEEPAATAIKSTSVTPINGAYKEGRKKMLYTIGYEKLSIKRLKEIVENLTISQIVDCRSTPTSRNPEYSITKLQEVFGSKFVWKGDILGSAAGKKMTDGLRWIKENLKPIPSSKSKPRVLLLCKEESPNSHRHTHISMPLLRSNHIDAMHIFDNEMILASELQRSIDKDDTYEFTRLAI